MGTHRIFISHYSEERPIAIAVQQVLRHAYAGHAEVFISFDIPVGTDWLDSVRSKLTASDEIITIFTHQSCERPWLNVETGFGIMAGKFVTPLLCRGFKLPDLPIMYRLHQAVNWQDESDVLRLFNDILSRIRNANPLAETRWEQDQFWKEWYSRVGAGIAKVPMSPIRPNRHPVVWLLGSHRYLETTAEQQRALQVCRVLARACLENRVQIVLGSSRMLEYLADEYTNYAEHPELLAEAGSEEWRKTIATEQAQFSGPAPNPVVILGSLRQRGIREVFDEAIGRIPDLAILIGGRPPELAGRSSEEQQLANEAGIPLLPLKFTGGAAARVEDTLPERFKSKAAEIQKLTSNIDRLRIALTEIIQGMALKQM